MDSRKKYLKEQLSAALAMDHQATRKAKKEDYAGYWLLLARATLEPNAYEHLIRKLGISHFDAHNYRFLFMLDVWTIYLREPSELPPDHPNCKCIMPPLDEQEDKSA